jgi:mycofactocin precursor
VGASHYDRGMDNEDVVETADAETGIEKELLIEEISIDGMWTGIEEELLIEEISIDGMCGVY